MTSEQKEQIIRFRNQGMSYTKIARESGLSKETVRSFCRRNNLGGVMSHAESPHEDSSHCRFCGCLLTQIPKHKTRIFCSKECRVKWWKAHSDRVNQKAVYSFQCAHCGKSFTAYGNAKRKYCSHGCYIQNRFRRNMNA